MNPEILSRAQGAFLGQLGGDSLGSLVEFLSAEEIAERYLDGPRLLADGGTWSTLAGQPTDDSELALALARSIVSSGGYDEQAVACADGDWLLSGPFDVGNATSRALRGASLGRVRGKAAQWAREAADSSTQANGALMRISPLGIYGAFLSVDEVVRLGRLDAGLTHPHPICRDASAIFAAAIAFAVRTGGSGRDTYEFAVETARAMGMAAAVVERLERAREFPPQDYFRQQGWVLTAFQNAFYYLLHAINLEEGVVATVRAGGDTDTNGAIAGALLGAVYGRDAVPGQWVERILACRPEAGLPGVAQPRPEIYWPVDALAVAESLLRIGIEQPRQE